MACLVVTEMGCVFWEVRGHSWKVFQISCRL